MSTYFPSVEGAGVSTERLANKAEMYRLLVDRDLGYLVADTLVYAGGTLSEGISIMGERHPGQDLFAKKADGTCGLEVFHGSPDSLARKLRGVDPKGEWVIQPMVCYDEEHRVFVRVAPPEDGGFSVLHAINPSSHRYYWDENPAIARSLFDATVMILKAMNVKNGQSERLIMRLDYFVRNGELVFLNEINCDEVPEQTVHSISLREMVGTVDLRAVLTRSMCSNRWHDGHVLQFLPSRPSCSVCAK